MELVQVKDEMSPTATVFVTDPPSGGWPWDGKIKGEVIGRTFFLQYSEAFLSPLAIWCFNKTGSVYIKPFERIHEHLAALFGESWKRKWEIMELQYDPLENYRMTESGSDNEKHNISEGVDDNITRNRTSESDGRDTGTDTRKDNRHSFQAQTPVPTDGSESSSTATTHDTTTDNETETRGSNRTEGGTRDTTHTLTRSGNIGVTTSQQMAQSQLDLWQWSYVQDVIKDVASVLCLDVY